MVLSFVVGWFGIPYVLANAVGLIIPSLVLL